MGFFLITLFVGLLIFGLSLYVMERVELSHSSREFTVGCAMVAMVVGVVMAVCSVFFFLFTGIDKISESVNREKLKNERGKYMRLLNEDYNAGNLSVALEFNEKYKLCKFRESTFMWSHYNTNGVCADTIPIPTGKFMPTQKIKISSDSTGQ